MLRSMQSPVASLCKHCVANFGRGSQKLFFGQNSGEKFRNVVQTISSKLNLLSILFAQQCNRVATLRLRRAHQILVLYQRIYGEQVLMQKLKTNVPKNGRPLLALLSATLFQWDSERVPDNEMKRIREEIEEVHKMVEYSHKKNEVQQCSNEFSEWEEICDNPDFKVWRRFMEATQLYEYRVFGHFKDIPPRAFYNTQVDVAYWKVWDKNTIDVHVVDKDNESTSEVVHWVYKFPYPMYPRDYVYVRRYMVDPASNTMVITAKATDHPSCPLKDNIVRVKTYSSQMVIKPYTTFDENGFEYLMTYLDDPQTNFPSVCYKWMASTGVYEFLEKVHRAASKKNERNVESACFDNNSENLYKMAHH